jgi:hypothetical protein
MVVMPQTHKVVQACLSLEGGAVKLLKLLHQSSLLLVEVGAVLLLKMKLLLTVVERGVYLRRTHR